MSITKDYMLEVQESTCAVCEEDMTEGVEVCDVCGCRAHDDCVTSYGEEPLKREVWCGNCENRFHHAVTKDD